jgi:hypothetical protein
VKKRPKRASPLTKQGSGRAGFSAGLRLQIQTEKKELEADGAPWKDFVAQLKLDENGRHELPLLDEDAKRRRLAMDEKIKVAGGNMPLAHATQEERDAAHRESKLAYQLRSKENKFHFDELHMVGCDDQTCPFYHGGLKECDCMDDIPSAAVTKVKIEHKTAITLRDPPYPTCLLEADHTTGVSSHWANVPSSVTLDPSPTRLPSSLRRIPRCGALYVGTKSGGPSGDVRAPPQQLLGPSHRRWCA